MEPKISKYKSFTVQDFLWDGDFIACCKNRPEAGNSLWMQVLKDSLEQAGNIADARSFLLQATVREKIFVE